VLEVSEKTGKVKPIEQAQEVSPLASEIDQAAVQGEKGVYTGSSHVEAIQKAQKAGEDISIKDKQKEGKFTTTDGRLIDRNQAREEFGITQSHEVPKLAEEQKAQGLVDKKSFTTEKKQNGSIIGGKKQQGGDIEKVSKKAKDIEKIAKDSGFIKEGESIDKAKYKGRSIKKQTEKLSVISSQNGRIGKIARGEEELPSDISESFFFNVAAKELKDSGDIEGFTALAKNFSSGISEAASEMRLSQEGRDPAMQAVQSIMKDREKSLGVEMKKISEKTKGELSKITRESKVINVSKAQELLDKLMC